MRIYIVKKLGSNTINDALKAIEGAKQGSKKIRLNLNDCSCTVALEEYEVDMLLEQGFQLTIVGIEKPV
jgi:hypothetical protein